jgi:hypothetical protein
MDSATNISAARLHIVVGPLTGPEVQAEPYDPLPAGGADTFGCDFTADSGSASIYETAWTASFDPGSASASDPDPQSRILGAWATDEVDVRSTIDGTISTISGQFSVAMIGGFPQSAIGGTYRLVASASLTDNRVLVVAADVLCMAG